MGNRGSLQVVLSHSPNPDIGRGIGGYWSQPTDKGRKVAMPVTTLEEASEVVRWYIERNGLGAGNWTGGQVIAPSGSEIARISYNGRAWDNAGQEIALLN